jgi:DNA invertase Pin-like site-specific DNA recombinase
MNATSDPPTYAGAGALKVTAAHVQRAAYVYIRQSTLKQVAENPESQRNQRQMVARAQSLGWPASRIEVIDEDQGLSGSGSAYRSGFQRLVAAVSLGQVGIIIGYEVSRLARNNGDWYHLLDLAAVFGALIADNDGVYDPRQFNDRLLLGLKGTMSEAELHLLKQRLEAGRLRQVERGVYRQNLPTGLVRLPDGSVALDPDQQVQARIREVFTQFAALGSCGQVLRAMQREHTLLPRRQARGPDKGEIVWKAATHTAIYEIVCNPAYAGAFVYGRSQMDPTQRCAGRPYSGRIDRPQDAWQQCVRDVYPAYISWEQYEANQARMHANAAQYFQTAEATPGAAREGVALLQGIAVCGHCGYHRQVRYKPPHSHYYQCHAAPRRIGEPACPAIHGPSVDAVVVAAFFAALQPAQLDALAMVLEAQGVEHAQREAEWAMRLQRAEYAVQLAQRQYMHVDPENRLVAAELERRWEQQLHQLRALEQEIAACRARAVQPAALTPELRAQFTHISARLPELWPHLTPAQQKTLLRSLIASVVLTRVAPDQVAVRIIWVSGYASVDVVTVPTARGADVPDYAALIQRIGDLFQQGLDDAQIAARLESEGFHTAHRAGVAVTTVRDVRRAQGWLRCTGPHPQALPTGYLTTAQVAQQLGVNVLWVRYRLRTGFIAAGDTIRDPDSDQYLIRDAPELIACLRASIGKHMRFKR